MDLRKLVVRKFNEGWYQRKIANNINISRCVVHNIIKKSKEHYTIKNLLQIGRPRINSERSVRLLIRDAKNFQENCISKLN